MANYPRYKEAMFYNVNLRAKINSTFILSLQSLPVYIKYSDKKDMTFPRKVKSLMMYMRSTCIFDLHFTFWTSLSRQHKCLLNMLLCSTCSVIKIKSFYWFKHMRNMKVKMLWLWNYICLCTHILDPLFISLSFLVLCPSSLTSTFLVTFTVFCFLNLVNIFSFCPRTAL